jgi:general secretion pathway protein H
MYRRRPAGGFTLLELIVALSIVAIMLALVIPSFSGLGERRVIAESRRIASILKYVNDSAVVTREHCSITFDIATRTLTYLAVDGERTETFETFSALELPSRGRLTEGEFTVIFGQLGADEPVKVYLAEGEKKASVTLNNLSGRVKIEEEM